MNPTHLSIPMLLIISACRRPRACGLFVFFVSGVLACGDRQTASDETAAASRGDMGIERDLSQACNEVAEQFRKAGAARVDVRADSFPSLSESANRRGCGVRVEGTMGGRVTIPFLSKALADSLGASWIRDSTLIADAPGTSGTVYAVKRGDVVCLVQVNWQMKVRYDPRAEPPTYSADVGCAKP